MRLSALRHGFPARRARAETGFTMAELMVTMLLLGIVLTGLAALQVSTIRQVTQSKRSGEAMRLAQRVLERYKRIDYTQVTAKSWGIELYPGTSTQMANVAVDGYSAGPYAVWTLIENFVPGSSTVPEGRLVTVRVVWRDVARGNQATATSQFQEFNVTLSTQRYP